MQEITSLLLVYLVFELHLIFKKSLENFKNPRMCDDITLLLIYLNFEFPEKKFV
jgi:hypothetical protein